MTTRREHPARAAAHRAARKVSATIRATYDVDYAHGWCGPDWEKAVALDTLRACCRKAVELGGGVAGEHGIGKIHTDLVPIQHSSDIVARMKAWKSEYDPKWILGRGNIFPSP